MKIDYRNVNQDDFKILEDGQHRLKITDVDVSKNFDNEKWAIKITEINDKGNLLHFVNFTEKAARFNKMFFTLLGYDMDKPQNIEPHELLNKEFSAQTITKILDGKKYSNIDLFTSIDLNLDIPW